MSESWTLRWAPPTPWERVRMWWRSMTRHLWVKWVSLSTPMGELVFSRKMVKQVERHLMYGEDL